MKWYNNHAFWLPRAVLSYSYSEKVRKKLWKKLRAESIMREMSKKERASLNMIDQCVMWHRLPEYLEVKDCKKVNGLGIFAKQTLPKNKVLGVYGGVIVDENYVDNPYIFELLEDELFIDARHEGNFTRFINAAYPKENANVEAMRMKINGIPQVLFKTKKVIKAKDQLLYDYGDDYFKTLEMDPQVLTPKDR